MPEAQSAGGLRGLYSSSGESIRLGTDREGNLEVTLSGDAFHVISLLSDIEKHLNDIKTHLTLMNGEL